LEADRLLQRRPYRRLQGQRVGVYSLVQLPNRLVTPKNLRDNTENAHAINSRFKQVMEALESANIKLESTSDVPLHPSELVWDNEVSRISRRARRKASKLGRTILRFDEILHDLEIDLPRISKGMYFVGGTVFGVLITWLAS
jgi:hypothetical protein